MQRSLEVQMRVVNINEEVLKEAVYNFLEEKLSQKEKPKGKGQFEKAA